MIYFIICEFFDSELIKPGPCSKCFPKMSRHKSVLRLGLDSMVNCGIHFRNRIMINLKQG